MKYYAWHIYLVHKKLLKLSYRNSGTLTLAVLMTAALASCDKDKSMCVVDSGNTNDSWKASNTIHADFMVDREDYWFKPIIDAISDHGPREKEEYWREMLGSTDPRLALTAAIRQQYYYPWPETKSVLEKLIHSPRLGLRARAVQYYQQYYGVTHESVKLTIPLLESHCLSVHQSALSILGEIKAEQYEPELPKMLREIYRNRPNSEDQPSLTGWRDTNIFANVVANNMERRQKSQ